MLLLLRSRSTLNLAPPFVLGGQITALWVSVAVALFGAVRCRRRSRFRPEFMTKYAFSRPNGAPCLICRATLYLIVVFNSLVRRPPSALLLSLSCIQHYIVSIIPSFPLGFAPSPLALLHHRMNVAGLAEASHRQRCRRAAVSTTRSGGRPVGDPSRHAGNGSTGCREQVREVNGLITIALSIAQEYEASRRGTRPFLHAFTLFERMHF